MNDAIPTMSGEKPLYMQATGKMPYSLTNDYLFRALLQKNNRVLKHLICALLHLQPEKVQTVTIINPIVLGQAIDNKTFILDVRVLLDNSAVINLEMQIVNYRNWPERSLSYLCRNFDQLQKGQDYRESRPVVHIGFLDFALFPEHPEFYATYKMLNVKNHNVFTDKFVLSVVDLDQIRLATEEDRQWEIDYWAALFKAATWEEAKMLAEKNPILEDAVKTLYEMSEEEQIREQCMAREDYYRTINTYEAEILDRDQRLEEKDQQLSQKDRQLSQKDQQLSQKDQQLSQKDQQLSQKDQQLSQKDQQIEELMQEVRRLREQQNIDAE